jgi:hypothetical protein
MPFLLILARARTPLIEARLRGDGPSEEVPHGGAYLFVVGFHGEVAGVEKADLGVRNIAFLGFLQRLSVAKSP